MTDAFVLTRTTMPQQHEMTMEPLDEAVDHVRGGHDAAALLEVLAA